MKYLVFLISIMVITLSCKTSKQTVSNHKVDTLVVQFTSWSKGIDYKMKEKFDAFINDNYSQLIYEVNSYGREGEKEYCISSSGLSIQEFEQFVSSAKELLSESERVNVKENTNCRD